MRRGLRNRVHPQACTDAGANPTLQTQTCPFVRVKERRKPAAATRHIGGYWRAGADRCLLQNVTWLPARLRAADSAREMTSARWRRAWWLAGTTGW